MCNTVFRDRNGKIWRIYAELRPIGHLLFPKTIVWTIATFGKEVHEFQTFRSTEVIEDKNKTLNGEMDKTS